MFKSSTILFVLVVPVAIALSVPAHAQRTREIAALAVSQLDPSAVDAFVAEEATLCEMAGAKCVKPAEMLLSWG